MKKSKVSYKLIIFLMVILLSMSGCSFFNRPEEDKYSIKAETVENGLLTQESDVKKNELTILDFADENNNDIGEKSADFIQVNPKELPDYEGFMARLENICNIHEENAREYNCEDSTQYAYAVEWLLEPTQGILVWNSHESYDWPELVSGTERPENSLLAEQFYHEYEDGYTFYYYAEFDETDVNWALKNILNMLPINEEGIVKEGIIHQDGKYYIYWGNVGYIPPGIKVIAVYTDGINYYVAFDWQEFYPLDETLPAKTHYVILRQNNTDRGTVWSIVKTSAEPMFDVSEILSDFSDSPGIPFKEILGYDGYYIDEIDENIMYPIKWTRQAKGIA